MPEMNADALIVYGAEELICNAPWCAGIPLGIFRSKGVLHLNHPHHALHINYRSIAKEAVELLLKKIATGKSYPSKAIPFSEVPDNDRKK